MATNHPQPWSPLFLHVPELDKGEATWLPRLAMLWHFDQLHLTAKVCVLMVIDSSREKIKAGDGEADADADADGDLLWVINDG